MDQPTWKLWGFAYVLFCAAITGSLLFSYFKNKWLLHQWSKRQRLPLSQGGVTDAPPASPAGTWKLWLALVSTGFLIAGLAKIFESNPTTAFVG